jgi:hypothetical protein
VLPWCYGAEKEVIALRYEKPAVQDFGTIARHTFDNPGKGDKSDNTDFETDKWNEFSHPATMS